MPRSSLVLFLFFFINFTLPAQNQDIRWDKTDTAKPFIGALDPGSWNGIVAYDNGDKIFAFRIGAYTYEKGDLKFTDGGNNFYNSVYKVGQKDVEGNYAELDWALTPNCKWNWKWGKFDRYSVIGTLSENTATTDEHGIIVECYIPWDYKGEYTYNDRCISSNASEFKLFTNLAPDVVVDVDHINDIGPMKGIIDGKINGSKKGSSLVMIFKNKNALNFMCSSRSPYADPMKYMPDFKTISPELLDEIGGAFRERIKISGEFSDAADAISNNQNWMVSLIPHSDYQYIPASREKVFGGWTLFGWDSFFNSLLASVNDPSLAYMELQTLFKTQYPNGNIPNFRGNVKFGGSPDHSQPPVGSFLVWKLYQRSGYDKKWLKLSYEPLKKWYYWWTDDKNSGRPRRDGNKNGLLEWGADAKDSMIYAKYESGLENSPQWDKAEILKGGWTMNMDALDLNCLHAMDAEHLAKMAKELGYTEDEKKFNADYELIKKTVNEKLWDEKTGFYYDRIWDGKLSGVKSAANFYPLISGIATPERAALMIKKLNSAAEFQGNYPLPVVSHDHPASKDLNSGRVNISPPVNYLVYQGLKRYGFDSIAFEMANRSSSMFMKNYRSKGSSNESFNAITGEGMGQKFQADGSLLTLIAMEEYADVESWGKLRFGTLNPQKTGIEKLKLGKDIYSIENNNGTTVTKNGKLFLKTNTRAVIHLLTQNENEVSFEINCTNPGQFTYGPKNIVKQLIRGKNNITVYL